MKSKKREDTFAKMYRSPQYRLGMWILGFFTMLATYLTYRAKRGNDAFARIKEELRGTEEMRAQRERFGREALLQVKKKNAYFGKNASDAEEEKQAEEIARQGFEQFLRDAAKEKAQREGVHEITVASCYAELTGSPVILAASVLLSFPMYILMVLYTRPIAKYITERMLLLIFVLFGVTWLVFTILYIAPMDAATNILGQTATAEQIENFNHVYGLDQPYLVQLFRTFKNLLTFNMGNAYQGNEPVMTAIIARFPITIQLTFASMLVAIVIAVPAGIISAIRPYSSFDYIAMFIALLGLSIPNFWLGLMLILAFSINLGLLPATFQAGNWATLIMPAIVVGTGMSASIARMTRSSMLEVKNSDYILTARAKGLPEKRVVLKHILGNAMIPILTTLGMSFGNLLGGAAVTEKVFNINGIGSYIVNKQFVPDIPVVLAGVVYVSFVVSLMNLIVDILYAFVDPRIKSKMKNY